MKKIISTADICDKNPKKIKAAAPSGFRDFGKKKSFYGKIHTVKCFENNPVVKAVLEKKGTGKVLVVDGGGSYSCALLGDNLANIAINNNWSGIIINGCVRDSRRLSQLNIGIIALNTMPLKSSKKNEGQENVSVYFAGIDFIPGEYVYCDEDGIVVSELKII